MDRPAEPARACTDLDDVGLVGEVLAAGGKPFQARQLAHWVYAHGVESYERCANISKTLRAALSARLPLRSTHLELVSSAADGTEKLLLRLADREAVESVLIPEGERTTLCVSTQVGCPVACVFCASGLGGVRRNLRAGEIVEQVLHARQRLGPGRALTNLVVMGMGEPLANLGALLQGLERIHDPEGINLGARRITISTSGHPERMRALAKAPHAYNLALSLHAADDELRKRLVPTAKWPVHELVAAAREYFDTKGREVTFEVVLLAGVNDRPGDAEAIAALLLGFPCTVNLIPWNPVAEIGGLARPSEASVDRFAARLEALGINTTVRRQRGADESAACGQLRLRATGSPASSSSS